MSGSSQRSPLSIKNVPVLQVPVLKRVLAKTQVLCFYEAHGECEGFLSGRWPRSQTTIPTELVLVTKKAVIRSQSRKNYDFQVPVLTRVHFFKDGEITRVLFLKDTGTWQQVPVLTRVLAAKYPC